jgi:hypothetical protein
MWKPSLSYYESWVDFLRALDDRGALVRFQAHTPSLVTAQIGQFEAIDFGPQHLTLDLVSPDANREFAITIAELLFETLELEDMYFDKAFIQDLAAVEADYGRVRRQMVASLLGDSFTKDGVFDSATLLDGTAPIAGDEVAYQVEVGVLDREEAPARMLRQVGRADGPARDSLAAELIGLEYPAVALFSDWAWTVRRQIRGADDLSDLWNATESATMEAVERLEASLNLHDQPADRAN